MSQIKMQNNALETMQNFIFVDVFVGGGSVAVGIANNFPSAKIVINDLDEYIWSFWTVICTKDGLEKLISYIIQYKKPTVEDFRAWRQKANEKNLSTVDKAFLALFFNRTTFSGIFNSGPIGGFDQSGKYKIGCRYNASHMSGMVRSLSETFLNKKVQCYRKDYVDMLKEYKDKEEALLYLDPPYMKQGHLLYNHHMKSEQYAEMANLLKGCKAKWLVSHDDRPEFVKLFQGWADIKTIEGVPYTINSIRGKRRSELLISGR